MWECPGCTFERSLGQRYNDIQTQLVKLKVQLQTEWLLTVNRETAAASSSSGEVVTENCHMIQLLNQLANLLRPIAELFVKLRHAERARRLPKELPKEPPPKNAFWIKASFIDADMAFYALCTIYGPLQNCPSVDFLLVRHGEWATVKRRR
ncbi:unnamed protein product [Calypogeia fissa]